MIKAEEETDSGCADKSIDQDECRKDEEDHGFHIKLEPKGKCHIWHMRLKCYRRMLNRNTILLK